MSSEKIARSLSHSGTSPRTMRCARPSTMAVLPTPGSPISTGLFLVLRDRMRMTRRISSSRPITGSSLPRARLRHQVGAVLLQRLVGRLRVGAHHALAAAHRAQGLEERVVRRLRDPSRAADTVLPESASKASSRCSTETYSSLSRLASSCALTRARCSRWVTKIFPLSAPGPETRGRLAEFGFEALGDLRRRDVHFLEQAWHQALGLPRGERRAGVRRRPRRGRAAPPRPAPPAGPPATSGSGDSCPSRTSCRLRFGGLEARRLGKLLVELAFALAQGLGHYDAELGVEVAGAVGGRVALAAQAQPTAGGGARGDLDLHRAVQSVDGGRTAERRGPGSDRHRRVQVVAVATEARVRGDLDLQEKIAGLGSAELPRRPFPTGAAAGRASPLSGC